MVRYLFIVLLLTGCASQQECPPQIEVVERVPIKEFTTPILKLSEINEDSTTDQVIRALVIDIQMLKIAVKQRDNVLKAYNLEARM